MATTPEITGAVRGVTNTLDGYVVQTEDFDEQPLWHTVPDQFNKVAYEEPYDHRYSLTLSVISAGASTAAPARQNDVILYADHNWCVDSCKEAGTYNGDRKWSISAHRYDNWPEQPASQPSSSGSPSGSGDE